MNPMHRSAADWPACWLVAFIFLSTVRGDLTVADSHIPPSLALPTSSCNFSNYLQHFMVTSWEFQLDVPPEKCSFFDSKEAMVAAVELKLSEISRLISAFNLSTRSLRTSIYSQVSTALTRLDGSPLSGQQKSNVSSQKGPAFIRHREKYAYDGFLNFTPGRGDLTLKIKDVDLNTFPLLHKKLHFPRKSKKCHWSSRFRKPRLKWKIENDQYCSIGRASYEANYHPVPALKHAGLYTRSEVEACFPGLWRYFGLDSSLNGLPLPDYNRRYFSKSVWDASFSSGHVDGVVNWVAAFPTLLDALSGTMATAFGCELSFRVKRRTFASQSDLRSALDTIVAISELLHAEGWDSGVHAL